MDEEPKVTEARLYCTILSIYGFRYPQGSWNESPADSKGWLN